MVDVTHNNNDRSTADELVCAVFMIVYKLLFDGHNDFLFDLAAEFHCNQCRSVVIDNVGNGCKNTELYKALYDLAGRLLHSCGKLADVDLIGNHDLELLLLSDLKLELLHLIALFLTALCRCCLTLLALLCLVDDLLLAAFAVAVTVAALVAGHVVELLVILGYVHRCAASGIDNALLRYLARNMRLILFFLLFGSRLLRGVCFLGRLCSSGLFLLFLGRLCLSGLRRGRTYIRKTFGLIMLGQIFKYNVKLVVFKNLHVVFRSRSIIR